MRKKIVAGNWKMNKSYDEGIALIEETIKLLDAENVKDTEVIFCPPFIHLHKAAKLVKDKKHVSTGAQNCYSEESGAYTGEVSAGMIKSSGAEYVIIGHSERRQYFGETNQQLAKKVNLVLRHNLIPIYCCGEPLEVRESNKHFELVSTQIKEGLFHLTKDEINKIVIAYEPVWAIGTGKTASKEQAQEMHAHIRKLIAQQYDEKTANGISILYGGSCKPSNAKELFAQPDVDGGLIGGASLVAADFVGIVKGF